MCICLLAAGGLGAVVGFFAGWGVLIVGIPLMALGLGPAIPTLLIGALTAAYVTGGALFLVGLALPQRRSMAFGGLHIVGATGAPPLLRRQPP
jgi:hypothetical protein